MEKRIKISFVILTWNRYKFLEKCLERLVDSIYSPASCEIIVMDNGSTDKTCDVLNKYANSDLVKIRRRKANYGLNSYKRLFNHTEGEYIIIVDDDVIDFPDNIDQIFLDYINVYSDYGFIGLNVIQNEFTNGAKPPEDQYTDDKRKDKIIQNGPTGGWCTVFKKKDYRKVMLRFLLSNLNMKKSEDGLLALLFRNKLNLKSGLIKNEICLHACGPYYAKLYGHTSREIEKYKISGLDDLAELYKNFE